MRSYFLLATFLLATCLISVGAAPRSIQAADSTDSPTWVRDLAAKVRPAVVVISHTGRELTQQGLGTGFIIDREGLVATNLHVIGEGRPITVQTADGKALKVTAVHASDQALDLAILRVEGENLPALELGHAEKVPAGEPVVVMGNPQGLKYSVVSGVISSVREIDGRSMLQLAIPVEPGNSGGPVIDANGRVLGIVTMKSLLTQNLGFAVSVNDLKTLLEKPNPVPLERWLTIGRIDNSRWEPLMGARWQQRGGRILVSGTGQGFGGRSLLLSRDQPPELPYEVAVSVKLGDEAGAAGLVFHADGGDRHYGFYPSNGRLRLSRFEGPDVFAWKVLAEQENEHYRPGDWNRLKVRVEKNRLRCYVNDALVIESTDDGLTSGRVGLAKFRNTEAEFRRYAVGRELPIDRPDPAVVAEVKEKVEQLPPLAEMNAGLVSSLVESGAEPVGAALLQRAAELEQRASELKLMAADVRTAAVVAELKRLAGPAVQEIDLLRAALTIASLDEDDLDVEAYVAHVERMAEEIRDKLPPEASEAQKLAALNEYLFKDNGFHGSRTDYYHRANSYLSRVIDDREGLPITLSVLYMELGRRLGLKIEGVGLPGHFVVRHVPVEGEPQLIDVFESAEVLSRREAEKKILTLTGEPPTDGQFAAVSSRQILQRILLNLIANAQRPQAAPDREALIRYESAMLVMDPTLVRDRGMRAVCRWETGRTAAAIADLQVLINAAPPGLVLEELRSMQEHFRKTKPPRR